MARLSRRLSRRQPGGIDQGWGVCECVLGGGRVKEYVVLFFENIFKRILLGPM